MKKRLLNLPITLLFLALSVSIVAQEKRDLSNQCLAANDKDKRAIEEYLKRIPGTKEFLAKNQRRNKLDRPGLCLNLIGVKPGMKIGEAGAGAGYFTFFLSKKVGKSGVIYANDNDKFVLAALDHYAEESRQLKNIVTVLGNDTDLDHAFIGEDSDFWLSFGGINENHLFFPLYVLISPDGIIRYGGKAREGFAVMDTIIWNK